jgi:hypothetical protein
MNRDLSRIITIGIGITALLIVAASEAGCSEQPSPYGAANDTARGTCEAQWAVPVTHYSHRGWTSDCAESLPE